MAAPRTVPVTAVLVGHDGARWLPAVLAALAAQTVRPAHLVAVDTGSTDDTAELLRRATGEVLVLPRDTGFGAAVAAGLAAAPASDWVWLLHDDAAPAPDALEQLLAADPATVLRGPKAVDWGDPRVLLEVGLTTDGAGRRLTGLEPGEQDQGQRDAPREVLAVGTAGALVRRDVWDALGGLDPEIALFGDDLDLGRRVSAAGHRVAVVPSATVRHVRAATTGRRRPGALGHRPLADDRRGRAHVLLANAPAALLPLTVLRLLVHAVLAAVGLLLGRRFRAAVDELAALTALRPARLRRSRRRRADRSADVRPLLAPPGARWRGAVASAAGHLAALGLPTERRRPGPGVLVVAGLGLVALLAERSLLTGGGLAGGQLLPAPGGGSDLLAAWADGAEPSTGVLALLSAPLLGRAPLAVALLVLASVPLAGAVAWWATGRVVRRPVLRLWAAATWALLPVATGAVAAGRLGACAVQVALPAVLVAGHDLVTTDPRGRWHRAWALGLGLAALTALAPVLWPLAALLLLGPAVARRAARPVLACLVALAVPLLVLPADAGALLHGPGRLAAGLADADLAAWRLLLLWPGGPGLPAVAVTAGLLVAALGALLRRDRAGTVLAGWGLALAGLATAVALSRLVVDGRPVWPGVPLQLAAAGLLLAAVVGAEGLPEQLQRNAFGRRQLVAVLAVAVAAAVPVLCAVSWVVRGADGPLRRGTAEVLPAFARAELAATGLRALVLDPAPDGTVDYAVTGAAGPHLGDPPPLELDEVVADLLAPRGSDAAAALSTRAVRYVSLTGAGPEAALDAQAGLLRQPTEGRPLWRVVAPAQRLVLLSPGAAATALRDRAPTVAGTPATDRLPAGEPGRLLVLAEPAGDGWRATVDGDELQSTTAYGWAQAWRVPSAGGALAVDRDGRSVPVAAVVLGVLLVLAGPGGPRRRGLERVA